MFGIWKSKKPEVIKQDRWTFEQFECSPEEFYKSIEQELEVRQMPGLTIERIEHKEGGLLSAKRVYLRIRRERLVFDICLAPFGTYWFISRRYSLIPFSLKVWELVVVFLLLASVAGFYIALFGLVLGSSIFGGSILGIALLMNSLVSLGLHDLDAALLQIPVIGAIYECLFRKETYYREDTRNTYVDIVDTITKMKIDELVAEKDAKLVAYRDATPPSHPTVMALIGALLKIPRQ